MYDRPKCRDSSAYVNSVSAFALDVNGKLFAVFKTKQEAEKTKREIIADGDGLDKFEIRPVQSEGKLPFYMG